jgi:hypothetical protein
MSTGAIVIHVFDGRREPFDTTTRLLVTAIDGRRTNVFRQFVNASTVRLERLAVRDNLDDRHTILVSAKEHSDAGFTPVTVKANNEQVVNLMLLKRDATFAFEPFTTIEARADLHAFLCGEKPAEARALYERLAQDDKPALACLLNITTALEQMTLAPADGLDRNPLRSFKALASPAQQDRLFAWADARILAQVVHTAAKNDTGLSRLAKAPAGLHPGATVSFKQTDFGEGNVQFSFHENDKKRVNGVDCILVEADIDYFKDSLAHILLEVFPNKLKSKVHGKSSAQSLTDPRTVYGLRWIAGRQRRRDFAPPYVLN